jgi:type I restriction enzyme S subunit
MITDEPWLDSVPSHWKMVRTKSLLIERSTKGFPNEPLLAATQTKGVVRKEQYENRTVLALKDLHLLKLVRVGDFVISLRSFQGGIEYAREQGIISPAYTILYPKDSQNHRYLSLMFKSKPYIENLTLHVTGIRQGQNIDYVKLSRSALPLPPLDEQTAIVRYLDYVDRRIRRYIRAKQKLIRLLEEQKQAIIHQAVTRGLDPDVRLKPSGVEWLGDVPEHWEVIKLGWLISLVTGFPFKSDGFSINDSDIRLLRGINVSPSSIRWNSVVYWPERDLDTYSQFLLEVGDIVLGMDRPIINNGMRVAIVSEKDVPSLLLQRVARIRCRSKLESEYLMMIFNHKSFFDYLEPIFTGISVPHISPDQIMSFKIAIPSFSEQREILKKVWEHIQTISLKEEMAKKEIELLQEYRTRLITDVVTGKLDVRAAAAQLPDEVEALLDEEDETQEEEAGLEAEDEAEGEDEE